MGQDGVYSGDVVGCGRGTGCVTSQIHSHIPRELAYSLSFAKNTICPYRTVRYIQGAGIKPSHTPKWLTRKKFLKLSEVTK